MCVIVANSSGRRGQPVKSALILGDDDLLVSLVPPAVRERGVLVKGVHGVTTLAPPVVRERGALVSGVHGVTTLAPPAVRVRGALVSGVHGVLTLAPPVNLSLSTGHPREQPLLGHDDSMGDQRRAIRALTPAARRALVTREFGDQHDGVVLRQDLYEFGLTYDQVLAETTAGRWQRLGSKTVSISGPTLSREATWCVAVWESGSAAVLDGISSLLAAGLESWEEQIVHVSVRRGTRTRVREGVRIHHQRNLGRTMDTQPARTVPELAVLRAAAWAVSDRQALTILAMTLQQRLALPGRLLEAWAATERHRRRTLLDTAIPLVCDGAHALGEIDFARACRRWGLPEPSRQEVRHTSQGQIYLDVWFDDYGVHAEINGAQHYAGLAPVLDARRRNDRALVRDLTIEIPVLGLLTDEAGFLAQVAEALRQRG